MVDRPPSEEKIDAALEQSFPASDPPFFMAAAAVVGAPRHEGAATRGARPVVTDRAPSRDDPRAIRGAGGLAKRSP
jgi:hypothetical protein